VTNNCYAVVGLGNIGEEYSLTPHNAGFMVCDSLSSRFGFSFIFKSIFKAYLGNFFINNKKVFVVKPATYVNLSGQSVVSLLNFYKININSLIVVHDDIDLELGTLKIKKNSSSGGHRGVQSVIDLLGSNSFVRIKIGVGRKGNPRNFVLSKFEHNELDVVNNAVSRAEKAVCDIVENGLSYAMNLYNRKVV